MGSMVMVVMEVGEEAGVEDGEEVGAVDGGTVGVMVAQLVDLSTLLDR